MVSEATRDADVSITGINVTPLVDITLVLLIIFMVTAKIAVSQSLLLDLPKPSVQKSASQTVFSIELVADGTTRIDGAPVPGDESIFALGHEGHVREPSLRAVIKADDAVPHGRVIHVLDLLRQAGLDAIAFGQPAKGAAVPR